MNCPFQLEKTEQCWQLPMCKCWADRLYHDWYSVNILKIIQNSQTRDSWAPWKLHEYWYISCVCCFIWFELKELTSQNRTWKQRALCSEYLFKTDTQVLFMCSKWYDKMLPYASGTNGKSFILPQIGFFFLKHFSPLYIILREKKEQISIYSQYKC